MRIAHVTQAYYPVLGGVTEYVWPLAKELEKRGHENVVITGNAADNNDHGIRTIRIGRQVPIMMNGAHGSITVGLRLASGLRRLEQREHFDVIHVQSPLDPVLPIIACHALQAPKVGTFHTNRERHLLIELLPTYCRRALDALHTKIAVSHSAEQLITKYFPNTSFTILPTAVDTNWFSPAAEPFPQYRNGTFTVLYVGRMDPRKGAKYLFRAVQHLEGHIKDYRILVVGTGWMRKYYDKYIPLRLQHRVEFTGFASKKDLARYYRSADVFCAPSVGGESLGLVLIEAMGCGTAIVASDIDGYRWVVEPDKQGVLVPPRSPQHLADALIALSKDPDKVKALGEQGRKTALEKYGWPAAAAKIEAIYERAIAERNRG